MKGAYLRGGVRAKGRERARGRSTGSGGQVGMGRKEHVFRRQTLKNEGYARAEEGAKRREQPYPLEVEVEVGRSPPWVLPSQETGGCWCEFMRLPTGGAVSVFPDLRQASDQKINPQLPPPPRPWLSLPACLLVRVVSLVCVYPRHGNTNKTHSVSADMTVKLWDIEAGMNINTLSAHDQLIQDIVWDYYGNTYATSCKDKSLRIIDARSPQVAQASAVFFVFSLFVLRWRIIVHPCFGFSKRGSIGWPEMKARVRFVAERRATQSLSFFAFLWHRSCFVWSCSCLP